MCDDPSRVPDEDKYSLIVPDCLLHGWPGPGQFELVVESDTGGVGGGREHVCQHLHQCRNCL